MIFMLVLIAGFVVLTLYACCRVAGDTDRQAELWIQKEEGEEEP